MSNTQNPIIGTFEIKEIDGKKYKVMVVEEIVEVPEIENTQHTRNEN